jgi:hypothetical protein
MSSTLDLAAVAGVITGSDPHLPSGFPASGFGSNWAGAVGNPLEAMYYWMYDDGLGSNNEDCTTSTLGGCWGHRHNVLFSLLCNPCVIGAAWGQASPAATSVAELIVSAAASPHNDFTWAQEQQYLPAQEQS